LGDRPLSSGLPIGRFAERALESPVVALQHPIGATRSEDGVGRPKEGGQVLDEREAKRLSQFCSMTLQWHFDTVLISLHGEFDRSCEAPFREEFGRALDARATGLVLDLRELKFIDSPGLRMLLSLHGTARDDGLDLTILCGSGGVRRVLRETGLDGLLPIVDDEGAVPASDSPVSGREVLRSASTPTT
jgi:anti-anti-sigma factor